MILKCGERGQIERIVTMRRPEPWIPDKAVDGATTGKSSSCAWAGPSEVLFALGGEI